MQKVKVGFQISKEAVHILEEAKWRLRKSKNAIIEELIVRYLTASMGKKVGMGSDL